MSLHDRFEHAFRSAAPVDRLRSLTLCLACEGHDRDAIVAAFEEVRGRLRAEDRESDEDAVAEVMDFLVGWCSPHTRLPLDQAKEYSMLKATKPTAQALDEFDRFYREGGLRAMASPHVHYDAARCPHPGCQRSLEWIDFKLEPRGDPDGVNRPLVTAWWTGVGFVGRCPGCRGWIHFTTRAIRAVDDPEAAGLPQLPDDWHAVAQIA